MTNPHISQADTHWIVIARMHNGVKQLFCNKADGKPTAFPSEAAAQQFMMAENFTVEQIAETYFEQVEEG